ncbi:MAG: hypothetical protein D6805_09770 [Planctomycetota bacterium]|nr:MAG: hypothetical protein D6805_09770 [Planctomycetota bacterium]
MKRVKQRRKKRKIKTHDSFLKNVKRAKESLVPEIPQESPYYPLVEILEGAEETATGLLELSTLQQIWNLPTQTKEEIPISLFGFPSLKPNSKRLLVYHGIDERTYQSYQTHRPDISPTLLEFFRYFGTIIPLHLLKQKTLIFGLEPKIWPVPTNPPEIMNFICQLYWAADDEEFPGNPTLLLGFDEEENLWFLVDENDYVWTYDKSIQGVRNANYYDDDDVDQIEWPAYVHRILTRWTSQKQK